MRVFNRDILLLISLLYTLINATSSACQIYCKKRPDPEDCEARCRLAVKPRIAVSSVADDYLFNATYLLTMPTTSEITGSDMWRSTNSGVLYFTTRDGGVWKMIPRNRATEQQLQKIYQFPRELELLTTGDKGLYDIAFPKNFSRRLFYMSYSTLPQSGESFHDLVIGEFYLDPFDKVVTFVKEVERLPQIVEYRSGGFLKSSRQLTRTRPQILWMSSGGNEQSQEQLFLDEPRYSAIYGILPQSVQPDTERIYGKVYWASNIQNPYECDFCSGKSEMMCLLRSYNGTNITQVSLTLIPPSYIGEQDEQSNETTSILTTLMTNEGYRLSLKGLNGFYTFNANENCLPESLSYSKQNILGYGYQKKVFLSMPSCEDTNFESPKLLTLVRDSAKQLWSVQPTSIDFHGMKLVRTQLLSGELSNGLYYAGYDLNTGQQKMFIIERK